MARGSHSSPPTEWNTTLIDAGVVNGLTLEGTHEELKEQAATGSPAA
jgi:hypothetical protein